jgi:hypothetical protein
MDKLNIQEIQLLVIPGYIMVHLLTVLDDRDCYSAILVFVLNFTIYIYINNKKVREASNIC